MPWVIRSAWYASLLWAASHVLASSPPEYVEGQLVVRFVEGVIAIPDGAGGEMRLDSVETRDETTWALLDGVGIDRLRPLATY